MPEWDYRYRSRLSFKSNDVSGRDPVGFLSGMPIFWKGGEVELGKMVDCAVALGDSYGFAKPVGTGTEFDVLIDLGQGSQPLAAASMVRPERREPESRAARDTPGSGLRYRFRATMFFRENPVPGLDSFGFVEGIRVFWKGPAEKFVPEKPIPCAVALGQNYGFAIPLTEYDEDPGELEDLGQSEPLWSPRLAQPVAPSRPEPPVTARPGTPMYRPPPQTPAAPAPPKPEPMPSVRSPWAVRAPAFPPPPPQSAPDMQRELLRILEGGAPSPLRRALGKVAGEAAAEVLGEGLEPLRQTVAVLRKELVDARSDLAVTAKELRALKHGGAAGGVKSGKPRPADPNAMTEEEIAAQIVHQLYKNQKWGAVYTSVKNFQRGYNAKVDEGRVLKVVRALTKAGVLLPHAKTPDATYSLNPHQKGDVARILGLDEEEIDVDEPTEEAPAQAPAPTPSGDFVARASFEHTMRGVREEVAKLGKSLHAAVGDTAPRFELERLAERLEGIESRLAELQNAVTEQAERVEANSAGQANASG